MQEDELKEEIKRLKEALQEEKQRLSTVLESIADGVYTTDIQKRITFWNPTAERITGFAARDVLGKNCSDILRHTDENGVSLCATACPLTETMQARQPIVGKSVYSGTASGHPLPVSVSCSPIIGPDGEVLGAVEVFRDISDQKRLEHAKADFYSMLTHDLKSPLMVIMGYSELALNMLSGDENAELNEFLTAILNNGRRIHEMIDNVLSVSKIESGRMTLNLTPTFLEGLLEKLYNDFLPAASVRDISFKKDIARMPEAGLDVRLMERALSNLLTNAFKFTPKDGTVRMSARHDKADGKIVVEVSDTGVGIPKDEVERVFDMYYRTTSSSGTEGTGLGLSIVKAVTEAHGGTISVRSVLGSGSVFTVTLPA